MTGRPEPIEHPVFDDVNHSIAGNRCGGTEWAIILLLRERFGHFVPKWLLIKQAIDTETTDTDGANALRQRVFHLRRRLEGTPFCIRLLWGDSYGLFWR